MPRYIDAENIKLKGISVFDQNLEMLIPLSDVRKSLQMTPTADVQEVRHGEWVERVKIRKDGEARLVHWQCSLCGCFLGTNIANYCPNCGAKMDGDER